jgi:cell division protein ZapA
LRPLVRSTGQPGNRAAAQKQETALAQVTVKINGYSYTVGCEDGQEDHLVAMSQQVESRIDSIKSLGGQSGESRLLVLASLLMADELHDLRAELDALRASPARAAQPKDAETGKRISKLAARAEQIAEQLDRP